MAREREGYRDALERVRRQARGEMVTVTEAATILYGEANQYKKRKVTRTLIGWVGSGTGKAIPATVLARQIC